MEDLSFDQTESCLDSTTDVDNFEYTNFSSEQDHEYRMICKRVQESTTKSKQLTLQYMEVTNNRHKLPNKNNLK